MLNNNEKKCIHGVIEKCESQFVADMLEKKNLMLLDIQSRVANDFKQVRVTFDNKQTMQSYL